MIASPTAAAPTDDRARPARPILVAWPADAARRAGAAAAGRPCLLVVDDGARLPVVGPGEDWIRASADERDVAARLADLERRARVVAPDPLAPTVVAGPVAPGAHPLLECLAACPGRLVAGDRLLALAGPTAAHLAAAVAELRRLVEPLGWVLVAVGDGLLLESPQDGLR